jgi:N-methylhydantoinase A
MAAAARVHIAERGHDARKFALLVTGGGGPVHGCEVARRLGIKRIVCPPAAGVASALGLLVAPARIDRSATIARALSMLDWSAFESAYAALEADASRIVAETIPSVTRPSVQRLADMRFAGQGYEVVTELPDGPYRASSAPVIRAAFEQAYETLFGRRPPVAEIEIINIRVSLTAAAEAVRSTWISWMPARHRLRAATGSCASLPARRWPTLRSTSVPCSASDHASRDLRSSRKRRRRCSCRRARARRSMQPETS